MMLLNNFMRHCLATTLSLTLLSLTAFAQESPTNNQNQSQPPGSGSTEINRDRQQTGTTGHGSGTHTQQGTTSGQSSSSSTSMSSTGNTMSGSANVSGMTTTQVSGVINSVKRDKDSSMFEIKIKDMNGKKHTIHVSPSAVIMQNEQKVADSVLMKGANVQLEVYSTPSGVMTAKTITVTSTAATTSR